MATVKLKRGQESKVSSLPKEDGSLIFGYNTASTPATMQLDQNISGTVQRLNLSVANSSTSDYSKNSAALGSSSLQQIIDKINSASGSGNAFTSIDTAVNSTIKLTRANGGTVQKIINNVAHSTSATTSEKLSTARRINDILFDGTKDANITELRPIEITGKTIDLNTLDLNDNLVGEKLYFCGTDGGSSGISNKPKTTDEGFLLKVQQLRYYNNSEDYVTKQTLEYRNSKEKWVRYCYFKVWGNWILESVNGIASTANYAKNSNALGGSSLQQILDEISSTSGSGNAFTGIDTTTNNIVKLTRANGGTVQKTIDNVSHASTASYSSNSGQLQGHILGTTSAGSSATFANKIVYTSSDGVTELSRYIDFHGDATSRDFSTRLSASTPSKLIVSGPSASTVTAAYFEGNAKNSNALGGSSLSQIINYVSSHSGSSSYLNNYFPSRTDDANIDANGKGGLRTFKATSSMTANKPSDGHIIHFDWDTTGGYDAQLSLSIRTPHLQIRSQDQGTWSPWINVLDQTNYTNYIPVRTKTIDAGFSTAFRTQTQGSTAKNSFLSMIRNNTAGVSYSPQYGSGLAWGHSDTHGYLYVSYSQGDAYLGGGNADKLNWMKKIAFTDTKISNASTADYAKNSAALGGSSLQQILDSFNSGNIVADSATRIVSSSKSIANNFTIRTGVPTSSWTQYPIFPIYNTTDADLIAYKGKSLSILHMDGGVQRHDIVALNGANDGLVYATATSAGTTSSRIERILDGGNYGSLITNLNKQVTFANGLKAQKNVQMDGGNFSTGSTVTTGNGETSISNVKISVSGNTLVITTK